MRKIVASEFMSLDAVTQATGGAEEDTEGGFDQGGWTLPYWHNEIGTPFMRVMGESDAVLLGRKRGRSMPASGSRCRPATRSPTC